MGNNLIPPHDLKKFNIFLKSIYIIKPFKKLFSYPLYQCNTTKFVLFIFMKIINKKTVQSIWEEYKLIIFHLSQLF